jgi:hypothetical protein
VLSLLRKINLQALLTKAYRSVNLARCTQKEAKHRPAHRFVSLPLVLPTS